MADLAPGASWGSFRIDRLIGRGPAGTVYRATPSAGGPPVTLKIFHESLAETVLLRFEDDTRRVIGLHAPNILRVLSVGLEGGRRFFTTEAFDGRSLREIGRLPAREGCDLFLQSARALGAAWMRLILHRNLKPENILISAAGEVKIVDFGLAQEPTPYWSPERCKGQSSDMRSELYSLGAIFRESLTDRPPEIDALLEQMTRPQTFERVQMVEDVLSRLESFLTRPAAPPPPPPPPMRPPELVLPPMPEMPRAELKEARGSIVNTLGAIVDRRTLKVEPPPRMVLPPPPPVRPVEPAPIPEPPRVPRRSAVVPLILTLVIIGTFITMIFLRMEAKFERQRAAEAKARERMGEKIPVAKPKPPEPGPKPPPANSRVQEDWIQTKAAIRALEEEMRYPDAGDLCERFIRRQGPQAPPESQEALSELRAWAGFVQQAEASRKQVQGRRSLDLLDRGGPARAKDRERILARWCEEDWTETLRTVQLEINQDNPYRARELLDRFLKLPHHGGLHRTEAEARKLALLAEVEFADVDAQTDNLLRAHKEPEAIAAWEAYLAQPHKGGAQREEVEKRLAKLREDLRQTVYVGRSAVTRLVVSPDGKRVAFMADRIRVIDLASRTEVWSQSSPSLIRSMAFAGEPLLAAAFPYQIAFWDLEKKAEARTLKIASGSLFAMVLSRDGKRVLAARSDGSLLTWEGEADAPPKVEKDAAPGVTVMALSPDGTKLAMAAIRDKTIRVRDLSTGEEKKWAAGVGSGIALAWSPDGTRLASTSTDTIHLWDAADGKEIHSLKGHQGAVTCIAFASNGARLASGGADKSIRLWNLRDGSSAGTLAGHPERVTGLAGLPDGKLLSGGADGAVKIWSLPEVK